MRIALVADEDPGWGGIGTYTGVLGEALSALGHDVHLILRGWEQDGHESVNGLRVHRVTVPEPSWRRGTVALVSRVWTTRESLVFSARVARRLRDVAPDVIEAPEFHACGLMAALRARAAGQAPAVVTRLHAPSFVTARLGSEPRDLDQRVCEGLEAVSVHAAQAVSAPSRAVVAVVSRRWRVRSGRVRVVPNPIDAGTFSPGGESDEEEGRILVVGRVERAKGQDLMIEALPMIRRTVPAAHLVLVGGDGGRREQLERRTLELGVADAVSWMGALPRDKLPEVYRSASVCVVPSRFEAFPYTALEAMSCGRPVVATRVGGLVEVVEDGHDGVLVEPENPTALATGSARLLLDPKARRGLAAAARDRAVTSFAASAVAARMADLYAEVAG